MEDLKKGNFIGSIAILLWSTLALFTVLAGKIPPFQLLAISFSIAFCIGLVWLLKSGKKAFLELKQPFSVWLIGVGGLFGYHFFYFMAIKNAPAIEANLINYLWPLLIVLLSSFLPNEKLKYYHILGAFFGFMGAVLLVMKDGGTIELNKDYLLGYTLALLCALTWSSYSVISKKFAHISTHVVSGFCGLTMVFAWICHFIFEKTVTPTMTEFLASIMLGLGPVGGAFYVWDIGMKKGDIKFLGTLAYATPLLSTLLLILMGLANSSFNVWIACGLIITGSLVSSGKYLKRKKQI